MVHNCFIKCQVCGKITRIRLQVGWLQEHPVVVTCGECRTSLSGKVNLGQDHPALEYTFENADIVIDENADFIVECSGEFPVMKQNVAKESLEIPITPFIRFTNCMYSDNSYEEFCKTVASVLNTKKQWSFYKRILDLSDNLNNKYLLQEIRKLFDEKMMPCRNELETLRAVHMVEIHGFIGPLRPDVLKDLKFSSDILKLNSDQTIKFISFLNSDSGYNLKELQTLVYKVLAEFLDVFQALIPVLAVQYYKENSIDYENEGTTTSNFDTVKQFYLDVYEALGNLLVVPVALNNIKYRGDYNKLNPIVTSNISLLDFIGLSKANRYKYCVDTEIYTEKLGVIINSKLRNAIGHNDVKYDTSSQKITYITNSKDRAKKEEEYLLEFENEALRMFQGLLMTSEYIYRLRQIELMLKC